MSSITAKLAWLNPRPSRCHATVKALEAQWQRGRPETPTSERGRSAPWRGLANMPGARATIEAYLDGGKSAEKEWRKLLQLATARSPLLGAFVQQSRAAVAAPWQQLPPELKSEIARRCDPRTMAQLSQVSRAWCSIMRQPWLWRQAYPSEVLHRLPAGPDDWRTLVAEQVVMARGRRRTRHGSSGRPPAAAAVVAWQVAAPVERYGPQGLERLVRALIQGGRGAEAGAWLGRCTSWIRRALPTSSMTRRSGAAWRCCRRPWVVLRPYQWICDTPRRVPRL